MREKKTCVAMQSLLRLIARREAIGVGPGKHEICCLKDTIRIPRKLVRYRIARITPNVSSRRGPILKV